METLGEYFELYGTSVLFVIINALVPTLMFLLLPIEKYDSGKTEFNVTITRCVCSCHGSSLMGSMFLCRVFVVRILNLYALMAGWKISTNCGCVGEERKKVRRYLEGERHQTMSIWSRFSSEISE